MIDGQQRLTTIFLVLRYFNERLMEEHRKPVFSIAYETRPGSEAYLLSMSAEQAENNIDYLHMYRAFRTIAEWFKENPYVVNEMESTLLNRTHIIWYTLGETTNPVEVFTRLNIGKIPLTNAELIKALFLRTEALGSDDAERLAVQVNMAAEWDRMEYTLQDDAFWYFLTNAEPPSNRIGFLFQMMTAMMDTEGIPPSDPNFVFHAFHRAFSSSNAKAEWDKVKRHFLTLEEWYKDRFLFHLVGFLVHEGIRLQQLVAESQGQSKSEFRHYLVRRAFKKVMNTEWSNDDDHPAFRIRLTDRLAQLSYPDVEIRTAMLFFNIASLLQNMESNTRFQFDRFKTEHWDIEHIRAVTFNPPQRTDEQRQWLTHVIAYSTGTDNIEEQRLYIHDMEEGEWCNVLTGALEFLENEQPAFNDLYEHVLEKFNEIKEPSHIHGIGNLALLDRYTNRSYKNAVFPVKRKKIIERDKKGAFVPLCTKNVFLKYYCPQATDVMIWSLADAEAYEQAIVECLATFFYTQIPKP